jgi:hypothetical protein
MSGTDGGTSTAAGTATDTAATTTTTAADTTTTTTETTGAAQGAGTQGQSTQTIEQLQADVEKWKALSRKNEATAKAKTETDAAQKKLLAEVAQKLGIATTDGVPDPAAITAQLEAAQRESKARSTEVAVLRAASRLGADGDALLDSRAFVAQLEGLETTEAIEAAIKLAVAQSPAKYARSTGTAAATDAGTGTTTTTTGTASASTAGDFNGASGGQRQWTDADVARATPAQVQKAMDQGLLKTLLGG